jgi:hypothetical protein
MAEVTARGFAPAEAPDPEVAIARDIVKHAIWALPALLLVTFLVWGVNGAASAAFAAAIVVVNFLFAAWANARAARISAALLGAVAMFGFLIRLAIVFVAFWLARDASWMKVVPFGLTIVVTHVGLLFWEMKYISASLAYPGLKPVATSSATAPAAQKES